MASKNTELVIASTNANDVGTLRSADGAQRTLRHLVNHLEGALNGAHTVRTVTVRDTAVAAAAALTLTSVAAQTVVLVNGVPFTAVNGAATAGNNEFDISGNDTADATALAAAINASTTAGISGVVTASAGTNIVTITAAAVGAVGNGLTVENLGIVASGTVTYSSSSGAQTVVVNGVTAYNATGASDAANATAAAAAINASTDPLVQPFVRALARAGVVWVFSLWGGADGNAVTLAATGTGATASGARLTGGTVAQYEGAQASGTWTITSGSGSVTCTLNGVNTSVTWASSDANTATLMFNALSQQTSALIAGLFTFSVASNVVTITADRGGKVGNMFTLAASGTGAAASGARLTGGAVPTSVAISGGTLTPTQSGARLGSGSSSTPITFTL